MQGGGQSGSSGGQYGWPSSGSATTQPVASPQPNTSVPVSTQPVNQPNQQMVPLSQPNTGYNQQQINAFANSQPMAQTQVMPNNTGLQAFNQAQINQLAGAPNYTPPSVNMNPPAHPAPPLGRSASEAMHDAMMNPKFQNGGGQLLANGHPAYAMRGGMRQQGQPTSPIPAQASTNGQ